MPEKLLAIVMVLVSNPQPVIDLLTAAVPLLAILLAAYALHIVATRDRGEP